MIQLKYSHSWSLTIEEAKKIQEKLQHLVITQDCLPEIRYIAGVDVGFEDNYRISKAAIAILTFPQLQVVQTAIARYPTSFPYIPGYLSFREIPVIIKAWEQLTITPDLTLCDGQGIAHPRRFGLACHLGVLLDLPTIGVAKSRFIGDHGELGQNKGDWQYLYSENEIIGAVVRSRSKVKPLYVSIGHKISLLTAIDYVLRCTSRYRLPETTRLADRLSKRDANLELSK